ncbi:MaoC/PaaZ C-terminal domain-containing protein [Oceanibacterium hippocampi]|uniref:Bifunctional enoyl-CoA hydratase/phosphate acetyltransferase n=1 Tax=Oceanibacterium hippocampi TaxID=745714 RepID=A0A1Y5TH79_9PROT|nr:MaoC/PaaZ C-terminal domain-containing protein [Oceanibacterium hippocampi]SLN63715.1 bifunctional enoyl-CoA hydratase/phosphate acetyltransferase [Oceanibacterium hippocampi]
MTSGQTERRSFEAVNVGDRFEFSKPPVTTMQLAMYAGASGDFNRIHYDHHFSIEAGLGGVIAHGMLTMGMLAQAVTEWAGPGALVRDIRSRFLSPVRPGDVVVFKGNITEKNGSPVNGDCRLELDGYVVDRLVIRGAATVRLPAA